MKSLRETALVFFAFTAIILILRAFPVVSDNAISLKSSELHFGAQDMSYKTNIPPEHIRPGDQTFLTYPEWFLVFSPDEFAKFIASNSPSEFPFFGHIVQFWQSYGAVSRVIALRYPFNFGYHLMVMVIGTSTTAEYAIKGLYENSVGALTSLFGSRTAEDDFYARYQADYVTFIRDKGWFMFSFMDEFKRLWTDIPLVGANPLRKIERRLFLSSELLSKALYGKLIMLGTNAVYDPVIEKTAVLYADGTLHLMPRADQFLKAIVPAAVGGGEFKEVAGNPGPIVVSVVGPREHRARFASNDLILAQPILTQEPLERFVVALPISELGSFLRTYSQAPFYIEHVYDY